MQRSLIILFFLAASLLAAQVPKSNDLAVLVQVKKGRIALRWAPANTEIWKAGNTYGYRIERVPLEQYLEANHDSLRFKNAQVISPTLLPWDKNDPRWKSLIEKNRSAGFLFANLFSAEKKNAPQNKEITFGILMKSCDVQADLAWAHGLMIIDSTFNVNEPYVYRILPNVSQKILRCAPALVIVNPKEVSVYPKIETLKAKFGDRKVVLSFVTLGVKDYSGYWIERSDDSVHYRSINKTPFIRTYSKYNKDKAESLFADSLPQNNNRYFYRVTGITCFGEEGASSNIVSGIGRETLIDFPLIDSTWIITNSAVSIKFHLSEKLDKTMLQGLTVFRSEKRSGGFVPVSTMLSPHAEIFTDNKPNDANYYKIALYTTSGDSICSMTTYAKLVDETPPAIPNEPTGNIDSNGVVNIRWLANTEKDLLGYRVYRCNGQKEQPVELTKKILTQPEFRDSINLKTLTREVFYTVRAVDKAHNNSAYSQYCKLIRPDKIKPIAIIFSSLVPTDSSINIFWHRSNSSDVKRYKLYRKDRNTEWQMIGQTSGEEKRNSFADTLVKPGLFYRYKMEVLDMSGNSSYTESHEILFKPVFLPKVKDLTAKVNLAERYIEVKWQPYNEVYNYVLYKAKDEGALQAFKTLPATTNVFIDKELYPSHKYRYAIKATLQSGAETKFTQVLIVEY